MNRATSMVALASVALLVSSCTVGVARMSVVDGAPAIAVCTDDTVTAVRVSELAPHGDRVEDWEVVWEGTGEKAVSAGSAILLTEGVEGLEVSAARPFSLASGTEFDIQVTLATGGVHNTIVRWPANGLQEGQWLNQSGGIRPTPCGE